MSSSLPKKFSEIDEIINWNMTHKMAIPIRSNLHIHSPYSFSAFKNIREAANMARQQGVFVLGISDFNTTEGYNEFTVECQKAGVFPLYNMETIALSVKDQESGKRWNDPSNPGAIYFCGKGLKYPPNYSQDVQNTLMKIAKASDIRVRLMLEKLNDYLENTLPVLKLDFNYIQNTMTHGSVRERHLAKALQQSIENSFHRIEDKKSALKLLYGFESKVDVNDPVAIQDELRSNFLKAGKVAFVEENPDAYLNFEGAKNLILNMGGIPCYPVLADRSKGELTERERDPDDLCNELLQRGIHCVEFITARNDIDLLRIYMTVFKNKGMIMTVGTEHNTSKMESMIPKCRGGVDLDESIRSIFWQGACVIAAHQYLVSKDQTGYVDANGNRTDKQIPQLESAGEAIIKYFKNNLK
jgi:hypothetical protein